jgi:hypothetical protein
MIYVCNEKQIDAIFIVNSFRQKLPHVSGIFVAHRQDVFTVYEQQLVRVIFYVSRSRTNKPTHTHTRA